MAKEWVETRRTGDGFGRGAGKRPPVVAVATRVQKYAGVNGTVSLSEGVVPASCIPAQIYDDSNLRGRPALFTSIRKRKEVSLKTKGGFFENEGRILLKDHIAGESWLHVSTRRSAAIQLWEVCFSCLKAAVSEVSPTDLMPEHEGRQGVHQEENDGQYHHILYIGYIGVMGGNMRSRNCCSYLWL